MIQEYRKASAEVFNEWHNKIYYQHRIDTIKFYRYFGNIPCQGASTEWCKKICLSKQIPFDTGPMTNYPDECPYNNFEFLIELINLLDAKYFVFFSSGCIEKVKWYPIGMKTLCEKFPEKIFQFYLRNYHQYLPLLPPNGRYSLSVDYTTKFNILNAFYDLKIHNINIINHPVNSDLKNFLLSKIDKTNVIRMITSCSECKRVDDEQRCIGKTNNKKLVIMDFMDKNYHKKGFPTMIKSNKL
ncbi:hypothetical protein LCGC14_1205300 [marine sediment metagenome]|uniref:Uncharacterized protein n=1 Tax=marine sediment metagenome TaxID=412755 RepID=A0A0F9M314_9ZZZZ